MNGGTGLVLPIVASLGGIVAFATAVFVIVRAVVRLVNTTEANTVAVNRLNATIDNTKDELYAVRERVARLEGRDGAVHT